MCLWGYIHTNPGTQGGPKLDLLEPELQTELPDEGPGNWTWVLPEEQYLFSAAEPSSQPNFYFLKLFMTTASTRQ